MSKVYTLRLPDDMAEEFEALVAKFRTNPNRLLRFAVGSLLSHYRIPPLPKQAIDDVEWMTYA